MDEEFGRRLGELTDDEHTDLFGAMAPTTPSEASELLRDVDIPWWIVGGWAIEKFTRSPRAHYDLDVSVRRSDLGLLVASLLPNHHVWARGSGQQCPLLYAEQELPPWSGQVSIRDHARAPWLIDVIVADDRDGRWVFQRDPSISFAIEESTWVAEDGLRYQRPEITLAYKAQHGRPQDDADFHLALPLLNPEARTWLRDTIRRLYQGHPWLAALNRNDC